MAVKKIGTLNKHQNPATNENEFNIENYMNVNWDKIKEVVDNNADELTTTQEKVTTLETDNTKNKQDISDIKSEQETQNDLLQRTQSALINITTPKSSNINVKDSSDLNAKIDVYGISEQKTRSGKNKFDINELINVLDENAETGSFTINNLYGSAIMLADNLVKLLKPNISYKCIADVTLLEKPDTSSNAYANLLVLYKSVAPQTNTAVLKCNSVEEKNSWQVNTTKRLETDFTTDSDLSQYQLLAYCYSGASGKFKFENIMILESTETDESFEQYGASPSPEYPSNIENVTGNIDITVYNKNLFNNTKTISNVTYNSEEDKWIFNLPNRYDHIAQKGTFFKNIKANTNYTLYFNILKNTSSAAILFNLTNTIWNNNIQISAKQTGVVVNNIKTKEDLSTALYDLWFSHSNAITGEFEAQIMICEGSETDNNYVKYQEQLIPFPLAEGQKLYDKDYPASDGIHHVRKQIELDGTENWQLTARDGYYAFWLMYNAIGMVDRYNKKICTHFLYYAQLFTEAPINSICENSESPNMIIFKVDFCTTIEEWKTYLSQQKAAGTPIIVEYELETEEIEPYTEEQQEAYNKLQNVLSYKTETNVFTDKAQLVFKYIADTQTWVLNKINNTNQQVLEIAGGN